jgi:hypothetical protein
MKRMILWSASLILTGVALWWGSQVPASAGGYSHNHFIGGPSDEISDQSPERSGFDRNADRVPDGDGEGSASDRGGPDGDGTASGIPDCNNGPGDGTGIGNPCGHPIASDTTPDHNGMGDSQGDGSGNGDHTGGGSDPSDYRAAINRIADEFSDGKPEHPHTGDAPDRVGLKDCANPGECDGRSSGPTDFRHDAVGIDGVRLAQDNSSDLTPDRATDIAAGFDDPKRPNRDGDARGSGCDGGGCGDVTPDRNNDLTPDITPDRNEDAGVSDQGAGPNADSIPDGTEDRSGVRDRGTWKAAQTARDAFTFGPHDASRDKFKGGGSDRGNFGYAGSGGGGCSLVAGSAASPASGLAYLLVLLAPAALVVIRRKLRRK